MFYSLYFVNYICHSLYRTLYTRIWITFVDSFALGMFNLEGGGRMCVYDPKTWGGGCKQKTEGWTASKNGGGSLSVSLQRPCPPPSPK